MHCQAIGRSEVEGKGGALANPQHVKWFSEGAESWNARRKESSFIPDLEGANLAAEILRPPYPESDSQIPSLEGISLIDSVLRRADFGQLQLPIANVAHTLGWPQRSQMLQDQPEPQHEGS